MMECFGIIFWGLVIYFIYLKITGDAERKQKEAEAERRAEAERIEKEHARVLHVTNRLTVLDETFEKAKNTLFLTYTGTISEFFKNRQSECNEMSKLLSELPFNARVNWESKIKILDKKTYVGLLWQYCNKIEELPKSKMLDLKNYGKHNKEYFKFVGELTEYYCRSYLQEVQTTLEKQDYKEIFNIDVERVLDIVWHYAIRKPFDSEKYQFAKGIFRKLVKSQHNDMEISGLYSLVQMGGENIVRNKIREYLEKRNGYTIFTTSPDRSINLTMLASSLMWMGVYGEESTVLQYMAAQGIPMSQKLQERMHSLSNGNGNAPKGFSVQSRDTKLYFDVSSLNWKDKEFDGFFENLAFQEKVLEYSLAMRDEDKDLFTTVGIVLPEKSVIAEEMKRLFEEEYGDCVTVSYKNAILLSGNGEEKIDGILITTKESNSLGVFVHIVRIGKKVNIKFYTLYMPQKIALNKEKQAVISLQKKMSPEVNAWENSLKDTVLLCLQKLINIAPTNVNTVKKENGGVVEF